MKEKYIKDLEQIKDIMNRSTRFISLSGFSGISTGIIALAGVFIAYLTIYKDHNYLVYTAVQLKNEEVIKLLLIAIGTLVISLAGAIIFTRHKTKKQNQSLWDIQTKRLLVNLLIPLVTGGLLTLMLLLNGFVGMLPSITLIFYGLALVNASKYSLPEIKNLGLIEVLLGLLAFQFIDYALHFWALGFGAFQIIFGILIQRKYSL